MRLKSFTEIQAWKEARIFVKDIYVMCNEGSAKHDFGFRAQIQNAAVSIMSNIAEGFGAGSDKSFIAFLRYAYRSALEVESQLYVALDIEYMDKIQAERFFDKIRTIQRMIGGLIAYLKQCEKTPQTPRPQNPQTP